MYDEEIVKQHTISQEQIETITEQVIETKTFGKEPVKNPVCVIVMGQTGSGKSGLIAHSKKMFPDGNVVVIEDDDIRKFFPNEKQIAKDHPEEHVPITNQLSRPATQKLFAALMKAGYNIVFHQTGGNKMIADDGMMNLVENGYSIVVNALAVSGEKSLASMIGRGLGQIEYEGYYRPVTIADHDRTLNGMPNTIKYIEEIGRFDVVQVFQRGPQPDQPVMVYSKINPDRPEHVANIASHPAVSAEDQFGEFSSAHEALIATREADRVAFIEQYPEIREGLVTSPFITPELAEQTVVLDQRVGFSPAPVTGPIDSFTE